MVKPFPCKRCGECCTMLSREEWTGISLFPWEKHLFPEKDIIPCLGLGEKPSDHKFKTILYTYNSPSCLHLQDRQCTIYNQRPLVCRSYPFRITRQGNKNVFIVAPECTAVKEWSSKTTIEERYLEMDTAELIGDHLSRFYKATESRWRYKQREGWTRIGTNKTSD